MKILFITSNRIGDAVLSTGLLTALIERHPAARITVACGPVAAPLFADLPGLDRVIAMPKRKRAGHWLALWRQTAGHWWDMVVDLRASAFSWTVPTLRRRVLRPSRAPQHRVEHLARVLRLDAPAAPRIWTSAARKAEAAKLIPPGGPVLAVGPTANWGGKQWRAENFAAAISRLTAPDGLFPEARIAVFGAPNERAAAQPVLDAIAPARRIDLVGNVDLLTVQACLERCAFYLGNDSGLMHMAAAAGIPTLGLFGPSPEIHYAPWGPKAAVVRTPQSYEQLVRSPSFDHRSQQSLMDGLTVDAVVAAAHKLWSRLHD